MLTVSHRSSGRVCAEGGKRVFHDTIIYQVTRVHWGEFRGGFQAVMGERQSGQRRRRDRKWVEEEEEEEKVVVQNGRRVGEGSRGRRGE